MRDGTQDVYEGSVNKALDYIHTHLAESLTLEVLSAEGCFSPYHFHRVFKAIVGETHQQYVNRVRLERAALLMDEGLPITEIALAVGFASSAHFAQAFKAHFGASPRAFRDRRKERKVSIVSRRGARHDWGTNSADAPIAVREYPAYRVAYVRHIGGYDFRIGFAWRKLMRWARENGCLSGENIRISCSWDSPELTEDGRLRYDACVTVPEGTVASGGVGVRLIPGGFFACVPFAGKTAELSGFYDRVYGEILPASGLRLLHDPGYRVHLENPLEQARGRFQNELRVPVAGR